MLGSAAAAAPHRRDATADRAAWLRSLTGMAPRCPAPLELPAGTSPAVPASLSGSGSPSARLRGTPVPRISLCLVVAPSRSSALARTWASLTRQSFAGWDATLLLEEGSNETTAPSAARLASVDRYRQGELAVALESWRRRAPGHLLGWLCAGDEIHPEGLGLFIDALAEDAGAEWLYCDEDRIDDSGRRIEPHFKPDWSPDRLVADFYTGQLSLFSATAVERAGGFPLAPDGRIGHDLALKLAGAGITGVHVPHVVFHHGCTGSDDPCHPSPPALPASTSDDRLPAVTVLVASRQCGALLENCVRSVLGRTDYPRLDVVVLNNADGGHRSDTLRGLAATGRVRVVDDPRPFNYSALHNAAIAASCSEALVLLNDDTEVIAAAWLRSMASWLRRPGVGAVGAKLYYANDTIQHAGVALAYRGRRPGHVHKGLGRDARGHHGDLVTPRNVSAVTGACLLIDRERYLRIGGMDEALPVAYNDIDICLKVRAAGARIVWDPAAELYHYEGQTRRDDAPRGPRFESEVQYLEAKWGAAFSTEHYFSPHIPAPREAPRDRVPDQPAAVPANPGA